MDFIYLLRVLLKRKWIVLGAAFLASALAYFLTRNEAKRYRSSAQISTGYAIKDVVSVNDKDWDPYAAETKFSNAIVTFNSDPVLSLLSYQLILHDLDPNNNPFRRLDGKQKASDAYNRINIEEARRVFQNRLDSMNMLTSFNPQERKLLEFLKLYGYDYKSLDRNLSVYRLQRTDYLQIDYLSENPELSAFVVNHIFEQFKRYSQGVRTVNATESIDTLKSIMDKKRQELDVKIALVNKLGGGYDPDFSGGTMDVAGDLRKSLQEEKSKKTQKEYELMRVNQKLLALTSASASNATTGNPRPTNNDELLAARRAAAEASIDAQADPNDQAKQDRYSRLQAVYLGLLKESGTSPTTTTGISTDKPRESKNDLLDRKSDLEFEVRGYEANIRSYEGQIGLLEGRAESLIAQGQNVETLKKERDLANQEWLAAKQRYNDAKDVSGSSINNFRQTIYGQPAIEPEPSKRKIIVAMAGAAALVTTMLIIIFLTYLDSSIKTPVIFSKAVNLKLISLVNFMDLKNKKLEDIVANRNHTEGVTDRNKFNAFRESIRKLRYEIENTGKKVFLFTSTKKGQGKTTLIQALSYSMSLSKKKILIIDTNFCNPDLTVQLNADPVLEKIVPYKANGVTLVEQVKNFSKDIGVGTVYAIGAEGGDYTPSEILPRENILHHLQALTTEFDFIFLEGPPLNDFSDSKELAQYVDGVIAVFSAGHIIKQIDKQSIAFFKELNGKFCGSILNMVDLKNVNAT
jgi:succinoglycan biosynthesis transport protein ExoP